MTVLTALQSAMIRLVGRKPNTVFSTTSQTEVELADLATEVAIDIMKSHDWQALTEIETITGDGATSAFPFPADYDRMVVASDLYDPETWAWGYHHIATVGEWIRYLDGNYIVPAQPGAWIILGNEFNFTPTPADGAVAKFPYISRNFALSAPASGTGIITPKAAFTADSDTFVLDERLITLGVIWRYREQKGMGYAEDMATYENALSQAQARDRGPSVIHTRISRVPRNVRFGWPGELGPDTY